MVVAGARLVAHVKAKWLPAASRDELMKKLLEVETPEPTSTWKPVSHALVIGLVEEVVREKGWAIVPRPSGPPFDVALGRMGKTMFGVCDLARAEDGSAGRPETGLSLGFRNSHDKTLALGIASGVRVFVCDNLAFSGEVVVKRVHRPDIDPRALIERAVEGFADNALVFQKRMDALKARYIGPQEASLVFMGMAQSEVFPRSRTFDLWNEYSACRVLDDQARAIKESRWFVYQFITDRAFKRESPLKLVKRSRALNEILMN